MQAASELTSPLGLNSGYYMYYSDKFFTSELNGNSALVETTGAGAAVWYFEPDGNNVKMYTYVDGVKKYLRNKSGNLVELTDSASAADTLEITAAGTDPESFYLKKSGENKWLQHSNGGGTVVMITEVNSPFPVESKIVLEDGEEGAFHINFDTPGIYNYDVMVMPDDRDITFDTTVYTACVSVKENDGELSTYLVVFNKATQEKPDSVHFENILAPHTEAPTEKPTQPAAPQPQTEPAASTHQPQTGDDTKMEIYLVIAMLASAGLFLLAVLYTVDTNKLYKKKKNRS